MNSKTIAWATLGEFTGYGRQGINYGHATTDEINKRTLNPNQYILSQVKGLKKCPYLFMSE